jgi:hypothetical protein
MFNDGMTKMTKMTYSRYVRNKSYRCLELSTDLPFMYLFDLGSVLIYRKHDQVKSIRLELYNDFESMEMRLT